jgi:hypothetical protein
MRRTTYILPKALHRLLTSFINFSAIQAVKVMLIAFEKYSLWILQKDCEVLKRKEEEKESSKIVDCTQKFRRIYN